MCKIRGLVLVTFLLLLAVSNIASAQVAVSTLEICIEANAKNQFAGSFTVTNVGDDAENVIVSLTDWDRDEYGRTRTREVKPNNRSATTLVTLSESYFTLESGEKKVVTFEGQLPENATGTYWTMFVVGSDQPDVIKKTSDDKVHTAITTRYGIKLYIDSRNVHREGRITNVKVADSESGKDESLQAVVTFENTGDANLIASGTLTIRDTAGSTAYETAIPEFLVLPGYTRLINIPVKSELPAGLYQVLVLIDYGGDVMVAGERVFEVEGEGDTL